MISVLIEANRSEYKNCGGTRDGIVNLLSKGTMVRALGKDATSQL